MWCIKLDAVKTSAYCACYNRPRKTQWPAYWFLHLPKQLSCTEQTLQQWAWRRTRQNEIHCFLHSSLPPTYDIKNVVSSCYWNWVKLKQMTSAPFSFRWTNLFFEHLMTPLGRELSCSPLAYLIFLSPHPNRTRTLRGVSVADGSQPLTCPQELHLAGH